MTPIIEEFFDPDTWTLSYIVYDESTRDAVIIDPVWDYDPAASKVDDRSMQQLLKFVKEQKLKIHLILETHAHADHLSSSQLLKERFPEAKLAIGSKIQDVQAVFKKIYHLDEHFPVDGSQFDLLLQEEEEITAGSLTIKAMETPGHTPACMSYIIGENVFTGDALFMPDYGTGRCDFPAGSAEDLYHSVHEKLYKLPDHYKVYVGHDYLPNGRALKFQSTIGEEKEKNIQLREATTKPEFVEFRKTRDAGLAAPRLLLPSVQVNINAGKLPEPEENGMSYLKIPIKS
jgi:glyoxylase-like metal-dependent hydrolase (beta-lactamase superfamily II)